jgi:hypothetical protein
MDEPGSLATTLMATMIPAFALLLQTVNCAAAGAAA